MAGAKELFSTSGYAAVRVDDIAAAVGCSRATFYLHFTSKLEVLRAIAEQSTAPSALHFYEDLDRVLDTGSRAEFVAWVSRAIEWFHEYRDLLPAWDEATALEPEFREIARNGILALPNAMTSYLDRWPADRADEARLRVELLVAQLEALFHPLGGPGHHPCLRRASRRGAHRYLVPRAAGAGRTGLSDRAICGPGSRVARYSLAAWESCSGTRFRSRV